VNADKTEAIALHTRVDPNISINGQRIKSVSQVKYLGYIVDHKLNGKNHLNDRISKGYQKLYATLATLKQLKKIKLSAKSNIVRACVLSVLGYGTEGCYTPSVYLKEANALEILQRKAARALLGTPSSTANECCTIDLGWETVQTHLEVRLLRFKARIERTARPGSILAACLATQKEYSLPFETHFQNILNKIDAPDFTVTDNSQFNLKHATARLMNNDYAKQIERLKSD
jgi:hypothetical protein